MVFDVQLSALTACVEAPLTAAPSAFSSVIKLFVSPKISATIPFASLEFVFASTSVTTTPGSTKSRGYTKNQQQQEKDKARWERSCSKVPSKVTSVSTDTV